MRPASLWKACMACAVSIGWTFMALGADAPRPNVLFLIADDWGWQHTSVGGCTWVKTPTFDRLAREGVRFTHCFTSNPKCSPCRASILTGRNTWQLEEACCHFGLFPAKFPVYTSLLERAGYHVGCTGKGWGPGNWKDGGFPHNPAGKEYNGHKLDPPLENVSKADLAANFQSFLEKRKPDQPFCFWVGTTEPHRPYQRDSGLRAGRRPEEVSVPGYLPDNDVIRRDLLDYAMEVEWSDQQFGRVLAVLETAGLLDSTLIVMTSDHGMPFPRVKGQIYEDGFHLPLAIRWGGHIRPGRVVDDFVNVRDFAPTFLTLAGVAVPPQMTGQSLAAILESEKSGRIEPSRDVMLVGKERHDLGRPHDGGYPVRAIRTKDYLLSHNYEPDRWPACNPETGLGNCDPGPSKEWIKQEEGRYYALSFGKRPEFELFSLADDPQCLHNLAADPKHAALLEQFRQRLDTMLRDEGDPRALGQGAVFDTYKYLGNRANKGYDEWLKSQGKTGD